MDDGTRRTRWTGATGVLLLAPLVLVASSPVTGAGGAAGGLVVGLSATDRSPPPGGPLLVPGVSLPLDLTVSNPYVVPVRVTGLEVRVGAVRPHVTEGCRAVDFVTSSAGLAHLVLPARSSTSLSAAGVPRAQWPRITMPAAASAFEGCRRLDVTLRFSVTARFA